MRHGGDDLELVVRDLGCVEYVPVWRAMQAFTSQRDADSADELWLVQHPPVYTLGRAGKPEHLLRDTGIPVVYTDRGGQITYHGPGQLVVYLLFDLQRLNLGVRLFVSLIENAVIDTLTGYGINATTRHGAPGVYVGNDKIAALGLRVTRGRSYHGLSMNVAMDLEPFNQINPCGYAGLGVTQLADLGGPNELAPVAARLVDAIKARAGYTAVRYTAPPDADEFRSTTTANRQANHG